MTKVYLSLAQSFPWPSPPFLPTYPPIYLPTYPQARLLYIAGVDDQGLSGIGLVISVAFTVLITLLAVFICAMLDPTADCAGSGLPLLKYILSGEVMDEAEEHLKSRTLIAKILGLVLAAGAGLSIGREGPNVHMASIISWIVMKNASWFDEIFRFPSLRRQILDAACAVGVSSTFAAPIGGVLFSIEATTNYYEISNYWKCFMAAVAGFGMTRMIGTFRGLPMYTLYSPGEPKVLLVHLPVYILVGVVMGLVGPLYTKVKVMIWSRFFPHNLHLTRRYLVAGCVAFISALLFYLPGPFTRLSIMASTQKLLNRQPLTDSTSEVGTSSEMVILAFYICVRFVTSVMDTSLQLPSGDFMCLFSTGAGLGRLIGLGIHYAFPDRKDINVSSFALCGAAALAGASTQTISSSVIAIELTGEYGHQLPVFLSVLAAYTISRGLSQSIYDALTLNRFMRYLPSIRTDLYYKLSAEDVMEKDIWYVPLATSYGKLIDLLKHHPFRAYPVVTVDQELLGLVKRRTLLKHLGRVFRAKGLMPELEKLMPLDISLVKNPTKAQARGIYGSGAKALESMMRSPEETTKLVQELLASTVDLRQATDVSVDPSAFRVSELCPLSDVYALFDLIRCNRVFVVSYGVLVGVISRRILIENITHLNDKPSSTFFAYSAGTSGVAGSSNGPSYLPSLNDRGDSIFANFKIRTHGSFRRNSRKAPATSK